MPALTAIFLALLSFLLLAVEKYLALDIRIDVSIPEKKGAKDREFGIRLQIDKVVLHQLPKYLIRGISLAGVLAVGILLLWFQDASWPRLNASRTWQLPAPHTLVCLLSLFMAAAAATYQQVRSLTVIQMTSLVVMILALSSIVGHLFDARSPLMGLGSPGNPAVTMALPTAFSLICLGAGFMVNAGRDFFLAVPVRKFSGFSAIALLLLSMGGLPVLLGWLIASLDWDVRYGRGSALALLVLSSVFLQLPVILHVARRLFFREYQLKEAVESLRDIVLQKEELAARLHELSRRDALTDLYNRRAFEEEFDRAWRRSLRKQQALSLLMVDIDHFKQYNDYYGHPAGDVCLVSVARILQKVVGREGDMVARLGGEEFALLLSDTDQVGARVVAEKLQDMLAEADLAHARSDTSSRVTLSVGVATCIPRRGLDVLMLMEAADKALYLAKQGGRNQAFVAPESG